MTSLIAFLVLIGVIITVHEFGHFIVAKAFGVKVETFSVGFGAPIIQTRYGETEYRIAWLPFGGYVKMAGMEPGEEGKAEDTEGRGINDKSPLARIMVYAAGPGMNMLLPFAIIVPFVAFSAKYEKVAGNQVGAVDQSMPAYAGGVREGDTIVAINGSAVSTFWQIKEHIEDYDPEQGALALTIDRPSESAPLQMNITPRAVQRHHPILGYASTDYLIGYQPAFLAANIAVLDPTGPAANAGLKTFDRVKTIDGKDTPRYIDVVQHLNGMVPGATAQLVVERTGAALDPRFEFLRKKETLNLVYTAPPAEARKDLGIGQSGACINSVDPNGPAAELLKAGDCLVSVNGVKQGLGAFLVRKLFDQRETAKDIEFIRDGQLMSGKLQQKSRVHMDPMAGEVTLWQLGFSLPRQTMVPPEDVANVNRMDHGWYEATSQVPRVLKETLRTIGGMFSGAVSPTQLSGPLTIFHLAGSHAQAGLDQFLRLMVLLSLSIGLFNLLPIPLLDGGHILVASVELITRRPLPERIQVGLQYIGLFMILALLIFALGNDAIRTWRLTNG